MYTQKVFKAGNSHDVVIPAQLLNELNIKSGDPVSISLSGNSVIINKKTNRPAGKKPKKNTKNGLMYL